MITWRDLKNRIDEMSDDEQVINTIFLVVFLQISVIIQLQLYLTTLLWCKKSNMVDNELEISMSEISNKTKKLKAMWTPCSELEKQAIVDSNLLKDKMKYYFDPGYGDDQPVMGFFNWSGSDFERVKKEYPDSMTPEEKQIILDYMNNSLRETSYMGMSTSRIDESFLGSSDMRTPDGKWIFPEQWDKHYVDKYNICPPREFVEDAIKWNGHQ